MNNIPAIVLPAKFFTLLLQIFLTIITLYSQEENIYNSIDDKYSKDSD